ncbi:MAG: hypothetical protein AAF720_00710 [Pseudomonadota bacterium]
MVKRFELAAAQGDCFLIKVDTLPELIQLAKSENGQFIVAHSETGHHHVIEANLDRVKMFDDPNDPLTAWIQVIADDVHLEHQRTFDTHEALNPAPGFYKVRRQREYTPEGFRRAAD